MAKLKLDLHDIYNRGGQIDTDLNRIVQEALAKKIALVEIIPGKGSGQLKKTVLRLRAGYSEASMSETTLDVAIKAVSLYAETHPQPPHVTQVQAAEMIGKSVPTVRKMVRAGIFRLNQCCMTPIMDIDRALVR